MKYEDFFTPEEVATFKRVKKGQMRLAGVVREVISELVAGNPARTGHHYIETWLGTFRIAVSSRSDNETERREHDRLGAEIVVASSRKQLGRFFARHGYQVETTLADFEQRVRERLHAA